MTMSADDDTEWREAAHSALTHYAIDVVRLERIAQGLVNLTCAATARDGRRYALQRLHPVFKAGVNRNIARVTGHLADKGLVTPRLLPTRAGETGVVLGERVWRMMTWVEGRAFDALATPAQAESAGRLLASFHLALVDFGDVLVVERPPIHDFVRHRERLDALLARHAGHRLHADVARAADEVAAMQARLPALERARLRTVHGDPKISNILFDPAGAHALCLIDLDTLARMPLALELGDAFRSWCNPHGEDSAAAAFDMTLFDAALAGYAAVARSFLTPAEVRALVPATLEIHLELSVRFLADALDESYFGWDRARYAGRGEHNLARARAQLAAGRSLALVGDAAERLVRGHFTLT